ncbi:MAG: glutamyl-tRNA amidotransferase [Micavibrio sp. TMED27]|nr:glutamyl-tRNA amidotransferase [Micavibrio sp.]OUT92024.1 MAG: glutamyl-tRNA amidotransferase [Micavibrio sp. TMED27]
MDKRAEFNAALKNAMKEKDQMVVSTIRLILAALKDRDISARAKGNAEGVDEKEILSMLQAMIKQRQESAKTYCDAGREELAEREEQEIAVIQKFLPKQLSDEEVSTIIDDLIAEVGAESVRDMGKVMGVMKEKYAGQVDMSKAGGIVKGKLA